MRESGSIVASGVDAARTRRPAIIERFARRAVLARFDAGAKLPLHKHVGDELIFMIEGSNFDESGEVRTGNANYRPNGCTHTVSSTHGGTALAFVTGSVAPGSKRVICARRLVAGSDHSIRALIVGVIGCHSSSLTWIICDGFEAASAMIFSVRNFRCAVLCRWC